MTARRNGQDMVIMSRTSRHHTLDFSFMPSLFGSRQDRSSEFMLGDVYDWAAGECGDKLQKPLQT